MKNSIVVFIALFFVCSSCSMWNIRQACAYRRQFHSDHDKYKYTEADTITSNGTQVYCNGETVRLNDIKRFYSTYAHDIEFVCEDSVYSEVKNYSETELLHADNVYVLSSLWLPPVAFKVMSLYRDCMDFSLKQSSWLGTSRKCQAFLLYYVRADLFEVEQVPYTDCPYHVYQRGKEGEFYKLLLPIKEECYDNCKGINEDVVKHIYEPNGEKEI